MRRWLLNIFAVFVAVVTLMYIIDAIVLQFRERSGSAQSAVVVENSYVIHLKSGKLEYLNDPPQPVSCVRLLFPHGGEPACWWLARHTLQQKDITAN